MWVCVGSNDGGRKKRFLALINYICDAEAYNKGRVVFHIEGVAQWICG